MTEQQRAYVEVRIPVPWGHVVGCWYGCRRQRPLLALHGWQDNAGSFARLAPLIAAYTPVLAIDLPGHGRSSHYPVGALYHTWDYVGLIRHLLHYFNWQQVSLMGHSMGATLCFHFAAVFPQLVDMIIAIDVVKTRYMQPDMQIATLQHLTEKSLLINASLPQRDPPLYSFAHLEELLHKGSEYSIDLEHCKHLLERSVTPNEAQPDKFYFSRDVRIKYMLELYTEPALTLEMARRIRNVNYLVIKAQHSRHFDKEDVAFAMLRANNPNFEQHDLANTKHHVHLNNAEEVARLVIPFVLKYRSKEHLTSVANVSKL